MKEILSCVEGALRSYSSKETDTPIRTVIPFGEENSSILMPSVAHQLNAMGFKYVTVVPPNAAAGRKVIQGLVCLSDMTTGKPLALLEGSFLTQLRTGALSGVATNYLARKDAKSLGIIGTGEQAKGLCEAIFAVRDIDTVYLYNRSPEKAASLKNSLEDSSERKVLICKAADEVVNNSDILVTATTSSTPVFTADLKPGTHINAVGAFKPTMQELPAQAICSAGKIVVECTEAALAEAGDLCIPISQGLYSTEQLHGELGQIISGQIDGRESDREITIFKSVGLAVADIVTAKYLYDKACENNAGVHVDLG